MGEGKVSLPPHTLKAAVAKQMAHTLLSHFLTVIFFNAFLLFIPLVKSPTSCHCLEENVRAVAACASPQLRALAGGGEEDFLGISASCGPGCRTGESADGRPLTNRNPPRGSEPVLHPSQPFLVLEVSTPQSTSLPVSWFPPPTSCEVSITIPIS